MIKIFRSLIIISTLFFVILWVLPFFNHLWLSQEELDLLTWVGYNSILPVPYYTYWFLFTLWLIISMGMFLFARIARIGYIVFILATTTLSLFWGFQIFTPFEVMLSTVLGILNGVVIAVSYFTSVSDEFSKR